MIITRQGIGGNLGITPLSIATTIGRQVRNSTNDNTMRTLNQKACVEPLIHIALKVRKCRVAPIQQPRTEYVTLRGHSIGTYHTYKIETCITSSFYYNITGYH